MKTILHFFPRFFPFSWGGAENYILSLINYQKKRSAKVYLLCTFPDEHLNVIYEEEIVSFSHHDAFQYEFEGITVICVKPKEFNLYDYSLFDKIKSEGQEYINDWRLIFEFFIKTEVTQLHVHSYERSFIYPHYLQAIRNQNKDVKIYTHCHDAIPCIKNTLVDSSNRACNGKADRLKCITCSTSLYEVPKSHHAFRFLKAKFAQLNTLFDVLAEHDKQTDLWITYSDLMKQNLLRNNFSKEVIVAKHGVNLMFQKNQIEDKPAGTTNFAYIGRFVEAKGLVNLLKVWRELPEKESRKIYLFGQQDVHSGTTITNLINELKTRRDVIFLGKRSPSEIAEMLDMIHCVIIPSTYQEIGPLVFNESLARGCNIIASNLGGMKEYAEEYQSKAISLFKHHKLPALKTLIEKFEYVKFERDLQLSSEEEHFDFLSAFLN